MKRKIFNISLNGELIATKNAWNSSRREVPKLIKAMLQEGDTAEYVQTRNIVRDEFKNCLSGFDVWEVSSGGVTKTIEFKIEKVQ